MIPHLKGKGNLGPQDGLHPQKLQSTGVHDDLFPLFGDTAHVGLGKAPLGAVFIHEADLGGSFREHAAVLEADGQAHARGLDLGMGGDGGDLLLGHLLEIAMAVAARLAEGVHLIAGIDGHGHGKQRRKQQRGQHNGGNGDQVPLPGGKQGFEAQAADAASIFHVHAITPGSQCGHPQSG